MVLAVERLLHMQHFAVNIVAMATAMFVGVAVGRAAEGLNLLLYSDSANGTVAINWRKEQEGKNIENFAFYIDKNERFCFLHRKN